MESDEFLIVGNPLNMRGGNGKCGIVRFFAGVPGGGGVSEEYPSPPGTLPVGTTGWVRSVVTIPHFFRTGPLPVLYCTGTVLYGTIFGTGTPLPSLLSYSSAVGLLYRTVRMHSEADFARYEPIMGGNIRVYHCPACPDGE